MHIVREVFKLRFIIFVDFCEGKFVFQQLAVRARFLLVLGLPIHFPHRKKVVVTSLNIGDVTHYLFHKNNAGFLQACTHLFRS